MRHLFVGLFLAVVAPGAATAGAWPQGDGGVFLSATRTRTLWPVPADRAPDTTSAYAEYGASDRLTLGAKYDRRLDGYGSALGFARWHFHSPEARTQTAVELGVGRLLSPDPDLAVSLGGHFGVGFQVRGKNGWAEAELRQTWRLSEGGGWRNLDLTAGLALTERLSAMVQTRLYDDASAGIEAVVIPTILLQGPFGVTTRTGVIIEPARHPARVALELGAWIEF